MSAASPPAPPVPFAGLDVDRLIAEEEQHQALEPPSPSTLGKRPSPSQDTGENEDDEPSGSEDESPTHHPVPVARPSSGSSRAEQAIRKVSKQLKLSPENTSLVEQFSKASAINQVLRR